MHDVSAAWLMTSLAPDPILVAMVQTAMTLPLFLLAIPAGALADIIDRRKCLLFALCWMMGTASLLGVLTLTGYMTPTILLVLTLSMGAGASLSIPTFAAVLPDLVPRRELLAAISLNGIAANATRAIGPAIAGVILVWSGPSTVFLINAATFMGMLIVLYRWQSEPRREALPSERFLGAVRVGIRFARQSPELQKVIMCGVLFFVAACCVLALLPLFTRQVLGGGPETLGILLSFFGAGAVGAAFMTQHLATIMPRQRLVFLGYIAFAIALLAIASLRSMYLLMPAMLLAGAAWLTVLASLQVASQMALPAWVRARGLAVFLTTMMGSMAGGSASWGWIARQSSISTSMYIAAGVLCLGALIVGKLSISDHEDADLSPIESWPDPGIVIPAEGDRGPVMVTIQYLITDDKRSEFLGLMRQIKRMRLRNGAASWSLFRDAAQPEKYTEFVLIESWLEYLRHRRRVTIDDRTLIRKVRTFHNGELPPVVNRSVAQKLPRNANMP